MRSTPRPVLFLGVIVLALTAVIAVSQWRAAHSQEVIPWQSDLTKAEATAAAQHKQVFAYFTATWCGPCQEMKRATWSDNTVWAALDRRYVPVKVDIDAQSDLARANNIEAVPTFIILTPEGKELRRRSGYMDAKEMSDWVENR